MVDEYIFAYDVAGMAKIALLIVALLILNVILQYGFILNFRSNFQHTAKVLTNI